MFEKLKNIFFSFLLTFFLVTSCSQSNMPIGIWNKETMVEFLTEAQLLEAKVQVKKMQETQRDSLYKIYYEELFSAFNTDRETWIKNIEYYKNNPEQLDEIYTEVVSKLSLLESEIDHETIE